MSADDTPIDKKTTLELILESCNRTEDHAKETRIFAERSHNVSLQMFEEHKSLRAEVDQLQLDQRKSWVGPVLSIIAAIISIACATVAAAH